MSQTVIEGDCVEQMWEMPAASVDAIVCDPPYGLEFMGKDWDKLDTRNYAGVSEGNGSPHARRHSVSFTGSPNPTCRKCGGLRSLATEGSGGRTKCRCGAPEFPDYRGNAARAMQAWHEAWAREALRVLKPGGHLLAFGGTRTYHRLACAVEDAGFEVRDTIMWLYGSGFPKSLDVSKAIDKAARGVPQGGADPSSPHHGKYRTQPRSTRDVTASLTDAEPWEGWGTALKPAHEPIVVARKPLAGTVAANVLAHGTGALNVDACRIGTKGATRKRVDEQRDPSVSAYGDGLNGGGGDRDLPFGRWPANVVLDEDVADLLDAQTGDRDNGRTIGHGLGAGTGDGIGGDSGGASRFFYCAKASRAERNAGLDGFEAAERRTMDGGAIVSEGRTQTRGATITRNPHPTVKPVELMRWLVRLVTPPGGTVLDPFAGSGTTGIACALEGFAFVGVEREAEYAAIARARIGLAVRDPRAFDPEVRLRRAAAPKASDQLGFLEDEAA